jgi:uncharacterized membrane protein HdeD (DUF308 family)
MTTTHPAGNPPTYLTPIQVKNQALCRTLAQNWWAIALRGAFAVLFGLLTFALPGITIATLVILFAAYMLVDGVFAIVGGVRAAQRGERWGYFILEGVANILAGLVALLWPAITVLVFVYLVAFWSIVSGLFMIAAAFKLTGEHGRWWMAIAGALSVVFGILLAVMPIAGAVVLTLWLGVYAVVFGVMLLVASFRLRAMRDASPPNFGAPAGAAGGPL